MFSACRATVLATFVLTLGGCSSTYILPLVAADHSRVVLLDEPALGAIGERSLGDTLVVSGVRTGTPGIEILRNGCMGDCLTSRSCEHRVILADQTVKPGFDLLEVDRKNKSRGKAACYEVKAEFPPSCSVLNTKMGAHNWFVCEDSSGWFGPVFDRGKLVEELPVELEISRVEIASRSEPSFKQEFIYNGRVGDYLKFIYREFSEDLARPAFTQEAQYDLASSREVGFKGLLIEVLDATNTTIRYRLVSSFD